MGVTFLITEEQSKPIRPGLYRAQVLEYEIIQAKYGPTVRITFQLVGSDITVTGLCSAPRNGKITTGMKLANWISAILNAPLNAGAVVDLDMLIGKECVVQVVNNIGLDSNGKQVIYNNVSLVLPISQVSPNMVIPPDQAQLVSQQPQVSQSLPPQPSMTSIPQPQSQPQQPQLQPQPQVQTQSQSQIQSQPQSQVQFQSSEPIQPQPMESPNLIQVEPRGQALPNQIGDFPIPNFGSEDEDIDDNDMPI